MNQITFKYHNSLLRLFEVVVMLCFVVTNSFFPISRVLTYVAIYREIDY